MKWRVQTSSIHGNGVFANKDIAANEDVGVSIPLLKEDSVTKVFERNTFGLLINDSQEPNVKCVKIGTDWHFVAIKLIEKDEEILIKYEEYQKEIRSEVQVTRKRVLVI